jgi:hypothetical protein
VAVEEWMRENDETRGRCPAVLTPFFAAVRLAL